MGINDLARNYEWDELACLEELANTAWHPVSEPPTEEDGDLDGCVATWGSGYVDTMPVGLVQEMSWAQPDLMWARINDVVLLPPDPAE